VDKQVIQEFWRKRAQTGQTRWTGEGMLEFDQNLLRPFVPSQARILDLGSGFGELSRSICPPEGTLVAVEQEAAMGSAFSGDPRFRFVNSYVTDFRGEALFDLALLFGVVTHLSVDEEEAVYAVIESALDAGGTAVIKNQCSDGAEFEVSTFSDDLGSSYVGRYPAIDEQRARLANHFSDVEVVPYPDSLRMHPDSTHVAFVCRKRVTE
jgi:hypothetical protein